jgi:glycerol-3-phosphate dehydrogenase
MRDVVIIGAGVIGCSVARELSRYRLDTVVLERGNDVATGTSKANSAIIHAGYDAKPGTVKAKMNIEGNPMFDTLSKELGFPFRRNGSLILCFDEASLPELEKLRERGERNGVPGLRVIGREELDALEPRLGRQAVAALLAPTGGIVCPYEMTIALYENARENGVSFLFGQAVTALEQTGGGFRVHTREGSWETRVLINAAGTHSDEIHNMLSARKMTIVPRAGQYFIFDRSVGSLVNHTVFQLPNEMGKGVLVTPTVDGNLMIGPTATDLDHKDDVTTNAAEADKLLRAALLTLDTLPMREMITAFTGIRAHSAGDDFVIGHVPDVPGMIDAAGIESPGLTGAPAIGNHVAGLVCGLLSPEENESFRPVRRGIPKFSEMDTEERRRKIAENPAYGHVVCRCETVTEGEIREAIRRGARDLDGVKRRTRAGMGRCQGGFCSTQILAMLAEELGLSPTEITKFGGHSNILIGRNKAI